MMRCPSTKFIMHTISHFIFLILLAAATFRLEDKRYSIDRTDDLNATRVPGDEAQYDEMAESLLKGTFRPANTLMTNVQMCLVFWVLGKLGSRSPWQCSS